MAGVAPGSGTRAGRELMFLRTLMVYLILTVWQDEPHHRWELPKSGVIRWRKIGGGGAGREEKEKNKGILG